MKSMHAKLLAEMLPEEVAKVLRGFGKVDMDGIAGATVDYLKEFKLMAHTKNLLTGDFVWVLTDDGKKIQKYLGTR